MIFKAPNISVSLSQPPLEPLIEARVATGATTYRVRGHAGLFGVLLDAEENVMKSIHAGVCAKKHIADQVLIATLNETAREALLRAMNGTFRDALLWHLENTDTRVVDLTTGAGVSRDVINKLLSGKSRSTVAENAVRIAAYFGKSLEQFMRCGADDERQTLAALTELLTPEEERMLLAQVRGILAQREPR